MQTSTLIPLVLLGGQFLVSSAMPRNGKYEVVVPQLRYSEYKVQGKDKYPSLVQYEIQLKGELVVILLEKTENLLSDDYIETLYRHDDTPVMITSEDQIQDHCHYQGYVKDDEGSAVSISTCSGVSGVILTQDRKFFIEPLNPSDNGKHAIYEAVEDIPNTMGAMISEDTLPDVKADQMAQMLTREDDDILSSQKYIELYMVADNSMFVAYNRNTSLIKNKLIQIVNYINLAYKTLNIFVALIGLEIWNTKNQIEVTLSIEDNLDRFAKWRQKILLSRIKHDNAQLISHIHFNGTRAGLAYTGSMCSDTHSVGVMQDYSTFASTVAATLAHEMGHNLGMNHDNSNCTCSEKACIMTATVSNKFLDYFSSCSVKQLRTFFSKLDPNCLLNKPNSKNIVSPAVCGNQFTELGEECDCGTEQECTNPCCNATTCKLQPNATCAQGACCDRCQIKEAGAVCRPSSGIDCDLPATCDGSSIHCPNNNWKENGVPCKNGQGYCYNGQCHTLEKQCIKLWGPGAVVGIHSCYTINTKGTIYGHCTQSNNTYVPCGKGDVMCGVLFCSGGTEVPKISGKTKVVHFKNCKGVLTSDGMVENGTKCGDSLVCSNGKCLSIDTVYPPNTVKIK